MATGQIKSLITDKGFGFIAPDEGRGGEDLFFHHSAVTGASFEQLQIGQRVSYDEGTDPRNPQRTRAVNVTPIED